MKWIVSSWIVLSCLAANAQDHPPLHEQKLRAELGLSDNEPLPIQTKSKAAPTVKKSRTKRAPTQATANPPQMSEKLRNELGWDEEEYIYDDEIEPNDPASTASASCETNIESQSSGIYKLKNIGIDTCDLTSGNRVAVVLTIDHSWGPITVEILNRELKTNDTQDGVTFDHWEYTDYGNAHIVGELTGTAATQTIRKNAAVGENKHGRLNEPWVIVTSIDNPSLKVQSVIVRR